MKKQKLWIDKELEKENTEPIPRSFFIKDYGDLEAQYGSFVIDQIVEKRLDELSSSHQ